MAATNKSKIHHEFKNWECILPFSSEPLPLYLIPKNLQSKRHKTIILYLKLLKSSSTWQ